jgi:quinol---cytochrome c reductase iron-sulfur subunit, bacillus type
MNRRKLLEWFVKIASVLIVGLMSLPVLRFIFPGAQKQRGGDWYPLLKLDPDSFLENVTQARVRKVIRDGWLSDIVEQYVWIVKKPDGQFLVLNSHCTHLGCLVSWNQESKAFLCPCHGGKFDESGNRIAGPPPRPLERYETKIENNVLLIKT